MTLFFSIVAFVLFSEFLFWTWSHRRLRPTRHARRWLPLLHLYMTFQLTGFLLIFLQRALRIPINLPPYILAPIYLWHLLILPATTLTLALGYALSPLTRLRPNPLSTESSPPQPGTRNSEPGTSSSVSSVTSGVNSPSPTRRQLLLATATALPPLLTGVSTATALLQLGNFRVRELTIPLASLPPALDGLTIAHVSDTHVGRFTNGQKLKNIAEVTNSLRADLILLTGDLIDYSLSDLPAALDMVKRLDPRSGLFMCQGNHDLFQSREAFDQQVRAAGFPLLVNQSATLTLRNHPVQILGAAWGARDDGKDAGVHTYVPYLSLLRDAGAFPILLAHHPHAFDPAADSHFPLTLAGHTHGGQLMLTPHLGPGPLFYRYYSGLYTKPIGSALVVSNGVGNWFPLRTNAPAEIIKITLRHQA